MAINIGIVGAGIAGLSTAKTLRQFGFDVTVFEKDAELGGVWAGSRRYPGLTTQNPRETYAFSDWPMPADYPEWPSGAQVQAYLESYATHFGLDDALKLRNEVVSASPTATGWTVETRTSGGERAIHAFDWLIVCNGIFSIPMIPAFEGSEAFVANGGEILHTSQFTRPDAAGRHLLVVGYGKSSCDVAAACSATAASTTVIARNLIWKIPKKLGGVLNFKHLFLNRLGEGLFRYVQVRGFERFLHGPALPIRNGMLRSVQAVVTRQLGLEKLGLKPTGKFETIARSTVSLVTDNFYEDVSTGRIRVVQGHITTLMPGKATLLNGETIPADVIVCGTGWDQRCDFLDPAVMAKVSDRAGNFRLYRSALPVGVPRLAFNGYNSSFFSQLNAEVGALWLADLLSGGFTPPADAVQNAEIDRKLAWMEERTDGKHSKGTNIIPFSVHHMDELLNDIDLALPLGLRLKHWLVAINAADYRGLLPRLLRRHGRALPAAR